MVNGTHIKHTNTTLFIVYLNVLLYATCFQLQRPIEPFMVEKLGTYHRDEILHHYDNNMPSGISGNSSGEYARLQSFFSVMQMIGSLLFGVLLDRLGSKGGFILSFLASAVPILFQTIPSLFIVFTGLLHSYMLCGHH